MNSEPEITNPETPSPETPSVDAPSINHNRAWTFLIFSIIVGSAYILSEDYRIPQTNWANCLGIGLACGTISLVTAAIILIFASGFPKDRTTWRIFISKLAIPMMLTGPFWVWRTDELLIQQRKRSRDLEEMREQARRNQAAKPVIELAKFKNDDSIRKMLRECEGSIKIAGWSALPLDGGTWLLQFQFSENGVDKWMLYEYNDYTLGFKSVIGDEALENLYLNRDGNSSSFKSTISIRVDEWYGPIR